MAQDPAALRRARGFALAVACAALLACSPQPKPEQFAGTWKSSRMATAPLHLHANGEWEIRSDAGAVMQYGVWQLEGRDFVWTIKQEDGRLLRDPNPIVAVKADRFELRERDGSVTVFRRLTAP